MSSVVITVRVPKRLKEELDRYGVIVSEVVRKAIEEEVERRRFEEASRAAGKLGEFFAKISEKEIVESIKGMRGLR